MTILIVFFNAFENTMVIHGFECLPEVYLSHGTFQGHPCAEAPPNSIK